MKFIDAFIRSSSHPKLLITIVLALILGFPAAAYAQPPSQQNQQTQAISLDAVNVDIRPEYDRPSVLVIMYIQVSAQVSLPAAMSIRIPASAGKPYAVAWQSPDKALFDMKYDMKAAGDWTDIEFTSPSSEIQIEYYDPSLQKTGNHRDFTFHWSQQYPVQNLSLQIQQPVNATNMTFRPDVGSGRPDNSGLMYYSLVVGKVNAGTTFDLEMSYDKPDDILTNPEQFQPAQSNQPIGGTASGRVAFDQFLPWGVGGLGLLLIVAGSFWYWRTGRAPSNRSSSNRPRHSPARSEKLASATAGAGEASFCHQCGKKAAPGDMYCRSCGTKLR